MRGVVRAVAALAVTVVAAGAVVAAPADAGLAYAGQMNITTGARLFDDISTLQYAVPRTVRTRIAGAVRTASMSTNTLCCRATDRELLAAANSTEGTAVVLDRALTRSEQRRYMGTTLWVDGDVLVAAPGNPQCAAGASLGQVRDLLEHGGSASEHVYAPASPYDGAPVALFGVPTTTRYSHAAAYSARVRIVGEQSAIQAVAGDPNGVAAVAWSAARAALSAGQVCEVPIGGVTASPSTLQSHRYPVSLRATFVVSRAHPAFARWILDWYLYRYMPSAKTRTLLHTDGGRNRLLP